MGEGIDYSPLLRRYNFKSDPRDVGAVVILSADESSYNGETGLSQLVS